MGKMAQTVSAEMVEQALRDVAADRFNGGNALDGRAGRHPLVLEALWRKRADGAAFKLYEECLKGHKIMGGTWCPPPTEPTPVQEMLASMTPWEHRQAMLGMDSMAETSARENDEASCDEAADNEEQHIRDRVFKLYC
jgi:hypothetical protein